MRAALIAILLAACTDGPEPVPSGPHYQYVMSELKIPKNNTFAREFSLDLNGDKAGDNQLGMVFGTLETLELGVASTAQEALLRGGITILADLQTTDLADSDAAGVTMYLGADPSPAPCVDPAQLSTCGQQLGGTGHFSIELGSASDLGTGPIDDGKLSAAMQTLSVEIALDAQAPLRLDMHDARVRFTGLTETGFSGVIGGMIVKADIDRVIVPQAATEIARIVGTECDLPAGVAPCGCVIGSRAELLQDHFDDNNDCEVSLLEVQEDDLVAALLATDVKTSGREALSFGVGVEFVRATFE